MPTPDGQRHAPRPTPASKLAYPVCTVRPSPPLPSTPRLHSTPKRSSWDLSDQKLKFNVETKKIQSRKLKWLRPRWVVLRGSRGWRGSLTQLPSSTELVERNPATSSAAAARASASRNTSWVWAATLAHEGLQAQHQTGGLDRYSQSN